MYNMFYKKPLKLRHTRVWRSYTGGMLLDQWQDRKKAEDGHIPEEWIASVVSARNINPIPNEGLSEVAVEGGNSPLLRDVIASDPETYLGIKHVQKYGTNMASLAKVIDSSCRLVIQVHPDKDYAKKYLNSDFGKTEAWYILRGRSISGEDPYVLFGFKKGITHESWKEMFYKQDISGMVNSLHRIPVKKGDVFLIPGGLPHAIGAGCFLIELQEPTDYTMRLERVSLDGIKLPDEWCHQGVGFEKMLDCFHYDTYTKEEITRKLYIKPNVIKEIDGGKEISLISSQNTSYFSMKKFEVFKSFKNKPEGSFFVAVVVSGSGKIKWENEQLDINQADEIFIPASIGEIIWGNNGQKNLEVICFYPPIV